VPLYVQGDFTVHPAVPAPVDYAVLKTTLGLVNGDSYVITLNEDRGESNFADQVVLYSVDIPVGTELLVGQGLSGTVMKTPEYTTRIVSSTLTAVTARIIEGNKDVTGAIATPGDSNYALVGTVDVANWYTLEVDLGNLVDQSRVLLVLDMVKHVPSAHNFDEFRAVAAKRLQGRTNYLQLWNGTNWNYQPNLNVVVVSGYFKRSVVDLSNLFVGNVFRVRLRTLYFTAYDYIAVDTDQSMSAYSIHSTLHPMRSAVLSHHGQNSFVSLGYGIGVMEYVNGEEPNRDPYLPGNYTRFGDVTSLLNVTDDVYVLFGTGDEVKVTFDALDTTVPSGKVRKFVVASNDFYNPGGTAVRSIPPVVGLYPYRSMPSYPYNTSRNHYPHEAYKKIYNTRGENLERYAAAIAPFKDFIYV